jgi:tetratricopeptide (TPR) repeat protein
MQQQNLQSKYHSLAQASLGKVISAMQSNQPDTAKKICQEFLLCHPSSLPHMQILGQAYIKTQCFEQAKRQIELTIKLAPDYAPIYEDMGSLLAMEHKYDEAVEAFDKALALQANLSSAHKKRAQALAMLGELNLSDEAFAQYLARDNNAALVVQGAEYWRERRFDEAQDTLKEALRNDPDNVDALRFLALTYLDQGRNSSDAEALLRRAIQIAPDFVQGLYTLGSILLEQQKWSDAVTIYSQLTQIESKDDMAWVGLGNAQSHMGNCEAALVAYQQALAIKPIAPGVNMAYAHMLKTVGLHEQALQHYRHAIQQKPELGEAYWSMANLKTCKFRPSEIKLMRSQLARGDLTEQARVHFNFALAKALEDNKDYQGAWRAYVVGNKTQRSLVEYDPVDFELHLASIKDVFSKAFVKQHKLTGNMAPDPIFIVGLPRSGSTLVEQILASHSLVEGTAELPNIGNIALSTAKYRRDGMFYPHTIHELQKRDWRGYGKEYLTQTAHHRVKKSPYFIDKMPNNFIHIGLIKLMLPNAKIINTRRHPVDSCLGAFKQLFAQGQNFTYDQFELVEYYKCYIDIMQHWHDVFPGEILDIHYEDTVTDLQAQVERLLTYCGLPFEKQCLQFYATQRHVKTASSEQVRLPIYTSALGLHNKYKENMHFWQHELQDIIRSLPDSVRQVST